MKIYKSLAKYCFLFLVINFQVFAQNHSENIKGLIFPSVYSSSLDLTNGNSFYCKDSLIISFQFALSKDTDIGNIFLIEDNSNFRMFFNVMPFINNDSIFLFFNYDKLVSKIKIPLIKKEISFYDFNDFSFRLNFKEQQLSLRFNNLFYNYSVDLPEDLTYRLIFGHPGNLSNTQGLNSAFFKVKDIKVNNDNKRISFWRLDEIEGNEAYDEISNRTAVYKDCIWIKSKHAFWEKMITGKSILNAGIAYNPNENKILIINEKDLFEFDTFTKTLDTIHFVNKRPKTANAAYFCEEKNSLYSYYYGQGMVSIFDKSNKTWSLIDSSKDVRQHYYGHSVFNDIDGNLFMLGGYGWYTVKNHLQKYNFQKKSWDLITTIGDTLSPRDNLIVATINNSNQIYIYGGSGNYSGKQEDGWKIFNDLYTLDLNNYKITKIWDNDFSKKRFYNFTPNAIYNKENKSLYFLIQIIEPNKSLDSSKNVHLINLVNLVIEKNDLIIFAKSNFRFKEIGNGGKSIWLDKNHNQIFIASLKDPYTGNKDSNEFSIYSLDFPPLNYEDELQKQKSKEASFVNLEKSYLTEFFVLLLISFSGILFFVLLNNYRRNKNKINQSHIFQNDISNEEEVFLNQDKAHIKNFIQVFSDFKAFDKYGNPITKLFSPKIRELFLLLLLNSFNIKNQHSFGISSTKITISLWPNSSDADAKNIRGITIHNLRQILDKFDGIDLIYENKLWLLKLKNYDIIDYVKLLTISQLINNISIDQASLDKIVFLIKDGGILPYESFSWLDEYKYLINNHIIDLLFSLINKLNSNLDHKLIIELADKILSIDEVHEKAMVLKLKELNKLGEYGKVKNTYNLFCKSYNELYAEDYMKKLEEILKENE